MHKNPSFLSFQWKNGLLYDWQDCNARTKVHGLVGASTFDFSSGSTYFIYQYAGISYLESALPLRPGYYASATAAQNYIHGSEECMALIIEHAGTEGVFLLGGPIEKQGRLKYIDGCTDSLLLAPWKKGEPCLNHLHFPAIIDQTPHTHPSIRIGIVAKGFGECITPFGNVDLVPGMVFAILPETGHQIRGRDGQFHDEGTHSFKTLSVEMDVIAFHPDSDFGPEDENHPMINRTIVNGTSAAQIEEIRTK